MTDQERRKRMAELILPELQAGDRRWFYISIANQTKFLGGVIVQAFGPTDAWRIMHCLDLYPRDRGADTQTYEFERDKTIPDELKWRLLSLEEVESIQ